MILPCQNAHIYQAHPKIVDQADRGKYRGGRKIAFKIDLISINIRCAIGRYRIPNVVFFQLTSRIYPNRTYILNDSKTIRLKLIGRFNETTDRKNYSYENAVKNEGETAQSRNLKVNYSKSRGIASFLSLETDPYRPQLKIPIVLSPLFVAANSRLSLFRADVSVEVQTCLHMVS